MSTTGQDLRRNDFSLSPEQEALQHAVRGLFSEESPPTRVRDSEASGFDESLWGHVSKMGLVRMGVSEERGGDGAGLVELALAAEAQGRAVAAVPLVEAMVAARLLAALESAELAGVLEGTSRCTIGPRPQAGPDAVLVPGATVFDHVLGYDGRDLVVLSDRVASPGPRNLGNAPLGWCDFTSTGTHATRTVLRSGPEAAELFATALTEWKVLMAAAQVGLAQGALDLAVQYAKERDAFAVPIGTFQAVAHPLADVRIAVEGARRLARKAAWFLDNEPTIAPLKVSMAYLYACETAHLATTVGIHTQGGFGFTLESDMQLYFHRAKGWTLVAGDPQDELAVIADLSYGPVTPFEQSRI